MKSTTKGKKVTDPGDSDPQDPAGVGGTVPAPPRSSSHVGLASRSAESLEGELAISVGAKGLAKMFAGKRGGTEGDKGSRRPLHPEKGPTARTSPDFAVAGPSGSQASTSGGAFKRPGPKTSKEMIQSRALVVEDSDEEDLSEAMSTVALSEEEDNVSLHMDVSADISQAQSSASKKRERGRLATTGEWVGVGAVRQELTQLKREHERIFAERDVLAGRVERAFDATAGGIPSANTFMDEMKNETSDTLLNTMMEALYAVNSVADKSGNLKGTLRSLLRVSARRGVAASKLLFVRASGSGGREEEDYDLALCDLRAAKSMIREADEKVRTLQEEVRILRAKETLRGTGKETPPPRLRRRTRVRRLLSSDEEEVEEQPLSTRKSMFGHAQTRGSQGAGPSGPPPSLDWIEQIVERVVERLRPSMTDADPPLSVPPVGGMDWEEGVERREFSRPPSKQRFPASSVPPPEGGGFKEVKKRKQRSRRNASRGTGSRPKKGPSQGTGAAQSEKKKPRKRKRKQATAGVVREPRTAAVLLSVAPGASTTMVDVLRGTRALTKETPGLLPASLKKARAGGTLIQLGGENNQRRADELATKMQQFVQNEKGVRVIRPVKRAELRITGLDVSITQREVSESIAEMTGCSEEDVSVGEIRDSPTNRSGSVWVRCPVAVSNKLLEMGKWHIGWSRVTAKPLPIRPMRCFRCLEVGHAMALCKGEDRTGRCYRCGSREHLASDCQARVLRCPLCADFGLPAAHALGAASCVPNWRAAERKKSALKTKEQEKTKDSRDEDLPERPASRKRMHFGSCEDFLEAVRISQRKAREGSEPRDHR